MSDDVTALRTGRLARARAVLRAVEDETGVPSAAVLGDSRQSDIAAARREVMVRLFREGMSIATVARTLGLNHTTVIYGLSRALGKTVYRAELAARAGGTPRLRVG